MFRKLLSLALIGLLINMVSIRSVYAGVKEEKQARFVEQVKESIAKLGTGANARVEVKLRDKTKLKGYVSKAGEDGFVVVDAKTGAATTVMYPQVKQVKGNNLSTSIKIAIGVGIAVAVILILTFAVGAIDR